MLIDTSGFFCLYDKADRDHSLAIQTYQTANQRITTSYVLSEYVALAETRGVPRSEIVRFSTRVLNDKDVRIVWIDEDFHNKSGRSTCSTAR